MHHIVHTTLCTTLCTTSCITSYTTSHKPTILHGEMTHICNVTQWTRIMGLCNTRVCGSEIADDQISMCGVYTSIPMVSAGRFSFGSALHFPPFMIISASLARGCSAVQIHIVQVQHSASKCKYTMLQGTVQYNSIKCCTLGKVLLAKALRLTFCIYEETHLNGYCHGVKCPPT